MNNKFTKVLPLCVAAFLALPFVTEHAYAAQGDVHADSSSSGREATISVEGSTADSRDGTVIKDCESKETNSWTDKQKKEVKYVQVGEKVEKIGKYSMAGLKELKEVDLPQALKTVGDHAFEGCDKLEKVTFQGTEKQWDEVDIGHQGNAKLENAKVEALSIGAEEIEVKTKDPVVGVDPEGKATSSVSSPKFTVEDMWEETESGKVKTSSARWSGKLEGEGKTLFDKFEDGVEYKHSIRLTIPKDLVDKGYKFDPALNDQNVKIKLDGHSITKQISLEENDTVATFTDLIEGLFAVPASEDTTGEGKDPKPEAAKKDEKKAEEAKKAEAAKKEASNSEFYKTGDASVLPLISTMLTSGLAAFASRKKKD